MELVNPVHPAELEAWSATLRTTFLQQPDPEEDARSAQRWAARLEPGRTWGAREDGRWVATLGSDARRLTIPATGGRTADVAVDALTAVTVNPTHRRRGLLTAMLTASLAAAKERGDAMSYLIAAEWPIYGRFGYAPATEVAEYTFHPRARGGTVAAGSGRVRQVDSAEVLARGPALFDRARFLRPGEINRHAHYWPSRFGGDKPDSRHNLVVAEGPDGTVDGYLAWQPRDDFELTALGSITVTDLVAATPDAYRCLWSYLSGVDVIDRVVLAERPVDEQVRWLLADGRTLRLTGGSDFTWLCLLDVAAAMTARGYDVADRLVIDVVDESAHGYAAGRFQLDASADGASCTATTRSPDLTLSARALGSAYLGGYRIAGRRIAGDVEEHTEGAVRRLDTLLGGSLAPYCGSGF